MRGAVLPRFYVTSWIQFITIKIYSLSSAQKPEENEVQLIIKKKKKILLVTGPDTQRVQSMSRGKIIIMPDSPYKVCLEWETGNPFPLQPLFSPHVPNDAYPILGVLAPSGGCSRQ